MSDKETTQETPATIVVDGKTWVDQSKFPSRVIAAFPKANAQDNTFFLICENGEVYRMHINQTDAQCLKLDLKFS